MSFTSKPSISASRASASSLVSPFLSHSEAVDVGDLSPVAEEQESAVSGAMLLESPFPSVYAMETDSRALDPHDAEVLEFLNELYDEEFDSAVLELLSSAESLYQGYLDQEFGDAVSKRIALQRRFEAYTHPVVQALEGFLDELSHELADQDLQRMTAEEINTFIDDFDASDSTVSPEFEEFIGKAKRKLKAAVKRAANVVKKQVTSVAKKGAQAARAVGKAVVSVVKSPLLQALNRLKGLVRPLLKRVLNQAINRLPAQYQSVAQQLKSQLFRSGVLKEAESVEGLMPEWEEDAIQDISTIQRELDDRIAYLVYGDNEVEQEAVIGEYEAMADRITAEDPLGDLDRAREYFIGEIIQLDDGEDATPLVENFVPALLPALRLGIRLAGRRRVIKFLAQYVARLIQRFVGKQYTPILSQAIVDAGLRLIQLETSAEDEIQAAGSAVAATVEETVHRVAALPDYVLDDERLLEGFVLEAFEAAAAANLPQILPQAVYEERPDLRESTRLKGTWVMGPRRRRKRFKKFSRTPRVKITPQMAGAIKTFRRQPLSAHLQNRLHLPAGRDLEAKVHLYEAIPGTSLSQIVQQETAVPGLGVGSDDQLHPLTPEAAGILLGEPGLGRAVSERHLDEPSLPAVGQRYFYLEIEEALPQIAAIRSRSGAGGRSSQLALTFDFPSDCIRTQVFLSEGEAQTLASKLRQRASVGRILARLLAVVDPGLRTALASGRHAGVRLIHGAITPEQSRGLALQWLPPIVLDKLCAQMGLWLGQHLAQHLQQHQQDFIAATENLEDGVTLAVDLRNPPGLPCLRKALAGEPVSFHSITFTEGTPNVTVSIRPGHSLG